MSKIRIKNFGPIKEGYLEYDGWLDIKKVTVFIGNQGSGKSTVAKLISTMSWLEKAYYRGDLIGEKMTAKEFVDEKCAYHRINNYITEKTEIHYKGDLFTIFYKNDTLEVYPTSENRIYGVPKIMYVPAERNFLSVVEEADNIEGLPMPIYTFNTEFSRSKKEINKQHIELPISKLKFKYDSRTETSQIIGEDYNVHLSEASSGLQSAVPLYLVSRNIAHSISERRKDNSKMNISLRQSLRKELEIFDVINDKKLSEVEKKEKIEQIEEKFTYKCFINIVEEPEQNLFPSSQQQILNCLLEFNNMNEGNKLIMTTHSPYLINYLTHAVKASMILDKMDNSNKKIELRSKLEEIVPINSVVGKEDWIVYELNEVDGTIIKLKDYKGLPSDANYLNERMAEGNEIFGKLLDIEDLCQ
jgi:predicted ATPase